MSSFSGRTDVASTIGDDEGGDLNLLVREIKESDWSSALASRFNALSLPNQFVVFVKMLHLGASKLADMAPDLRADFLKFSIPKFVTPLSMAACSGRKDFFEALLGRSDVDFNLAGENGFSPIHAAAQNGQIELVRYLIESCGVAVDANMPNGATSLAIASNAGATISDGHLEVIRYLLLKGASPLRYHDIADPGLIQHCPLMLAASSPKILKCYLEHEPSLAHKKFDNKSNVLRIAARRCISKDRKMTEKWMAYLLSAAGAPLNAAMVSKSDDEYQSNINVCKAFRTIAERFDPVGVDYLDTVLRVLKHGYGIFKRNSTLLLEVSVPPASSTFRPFESYFSGVETSASSGDGAGAGSGAGPVS